jgi:hypothetical protein
MKLPCGNLIPCGKNGFRGTRAKWNMKTCKWMIKWKHLWYYFLEWWCSLPEVVKVIEWCRLNGRIRDRRLSEDRGDIWLLCFFSISLYSTPSWTLLWQPPLCA